MFSTKLPSFPRHIAYVPILYLYNFALIMITYTFAYYHARHIIGTQFMVMAERMAACS